MQIKFECQVVPRKPFTGHYIYVPSFQISFWTAACVEWEIIFVIAFQEDQEEIETDTEIVQSIKERRR